MKNAKSQSVFLVHAQTIKLMYSKGSIFFLQFHCLSLHRNDWSSKMKLEKFELLGDRVYIQFEWFYHGISSMDSTSRFNLPAKYNYR